MRPRPPAIYQIPLKMPETEDLIWAGLAVVLVIALWRTRWRWGAVIGAVLFAITIWYDPTPLSTAGLEFVPERPRLPVDRPDRQPPDRRPVATVAARRSPSWP